MSNGVTLKGNEAPKALNQLAREQMKTKLLNDILMDLNICRIEGWDVHEYLNELHILIDSLSPTP